LRARAPIPIATGEALYTAWDFKRLLDQRAVDVVQPDLSMCGGIRVGREIALLARLQHVRLSPHVCGGGIGLAAACHFVASLPGYPHSRNIVPPPLIEYDVGDNALRDTIFKQPIAVENGACVLPTAQGWASSSTQPAFAVSTSRRSYGATRPLRTLRNPHLDMPATPERVTIDEIRRVRLCDKVCLAYDVRL
jgi:D-galactarolactone cycloisomerase